MAKVLNNQSGGTSKPSGNQSSGTNQSVGTSKPGGAIVGSGVTTRGL